MNYAALISPGDVRDYARNRGWTVVPAALAERLLVLNSPSTRYRQLIVPMDSDRADYDGAIRVAIETLAEEEARAFHAIEATLMEAGFDTLRFGVSTARRVEDGLPLGYAVRAMEGAEKALRAAACSEVQRQAFHPKMKRTEAQKMVEAAQLRHTESGSFVLKVACPIDAVLDEVSSQSRPPFVRRALIGMSDAVRRLVNALEMDTLDALVDEAKKDGQSPISSNLCEALVGFQDDELRSSMDFSVGWSSRLPGPPVEHCARVRIQWDYFPRIDQVRKALRPEPVPREQTFVGTVDELKGGFGPTEPMEGEVVLTLLVDGESVKAKANLSPEHHRLAHLAYASPKPAIQISGQLHPGNQPRRLSQIREFRIVPV